MCGVADLIRSRLWEGFARGKVVEDGEVFERAIDLFEEGGAILDDIADDVLCKGDVLDQVFGFLGFHFLVVRWSGPSGGYEVDCFHA